MFLLFTNETLFRSPGIKWTMIEAAWLNPEAAPFLCALPSLHLIPSFDGASGPGWKPRLHPTAPHPPCLSVLPRACWLHAGHLEGAFTVCFCFKIPREILRPTWLLNTNVGLPNCQAGAKVLEPKMTSAGFLCLLKSADTEMDGPSRSSLLASSLYRGRGWGPQSRGSACPVIPHHLLPT